MNRKRTNADTMVIYLALTNVILWTQHSFLVLQKNLLSMNSIIVYTVAFALLLLTATILLALYVRQRSKKAKAEEEDQTDGEPGTPFITAFASNPLYNKILKQSQESIGGKSEKSYYDNLVPNHQFHWNGKFLRNSDVK